MHRSIQAWSRSRKHRASEPATHPVGRSVAATPAASCCSPDSWVWFQKTCRCSRQAPLRHHFSRMDSGYSVRLTWGCHICCGHLARSHLSQEHLIGFLFTFSLTSRRHQLTLRPCPSSSHLYEEQEEHPQEPVLGTQTTRGPRAAGVTASSVLDMGWEATKMCCPPTPPRTGFGGRPYWAGPALVSERRTLKVYWM